MYRINKVSKGLQLEIKKSTRIHKESIPLLICPSMLRRISCGQVDISGIYYFRNEFIIRIFEVKSNGLISEQQRRRLFSSANFVSQFFDLSCTVSLI